MPTTPDRPAESILGPITPIRCPLTGCYWSVHGVPDKYADSRARIVREHLAAEHAPTPESPDRPADQLHAAAEKLRAAAASAHRASPAPWTATDEHVVRCADGMIVADRSSTDHPAERADLPYIALMHPGIANPVAWWLEWQAAVLADGHTAALDPALAVARQLLGTNTGEDTAADDTVHTCPDRWGGPGCRCFDDDQPTHPGADLFAALQHAGYDVDEANRRIYAYAAMVLRQEKATAAPPAPADRAATGDEWSALLNQAADRMKTSWFTDEATANAAKDDLRRLAGEAAAGAHHPTTADKAAALGVTPTEYRQHSHNTAVQQIQAAAQGLFAGTAIRVADALKEPPAKACTCDFIDEPWIKMRHADDCPAVPAAPEETQ